MNKDLFSIINYQSVSLITLRKKQMNTQTEMFPGKSFSITEAKYIYMFVWTVKSKKCVFRVKYFQLEVKNIVSRTSL